MIGYVYVECGLALCCEMLMWGGVWSLDVKFGCRVLLGTRVLYVEGGFSEDGGGDMGMWGAVGNADVKCGCGVQCGTRM